MERNRERESEKNKRSGSVLVTDIKTTPKRKKRVYVGMSRVCVHVYVCMWVGMYV